MHTIGKQGFVFSMDLAIAFVALLLISSLMIVHLNSAKEQRLLNIERISLQRKAIFLADSIVKNRNEENGCLGSAFFDGERHRILSNEIDLGLLSKAVPIEGENFFVAGLSYSIGKSKTVLWEQSFGNCVSVDRIVLIEGKTGNVRVKVCER